MKFGDKLKQLRNDCGYTQPQLAELAGIEQSYLSKLENERSTPSGEILTRILAVLNTTLTSFMEKLDPKAQQQLLQIPEVASHYKQNEVRIVKNRKKWLINCAILCVLGVGALFSGQQAVFFPTSTYNYASYGVVLSGESKEIFNNWDNNLMNLPPGSADEARQQQKTREELKLKMYQRQDEIFQLSYDYKGSQFNIPVKGGSRTYHQVGQPLTIERWQNKILMLIGILFFGTGIMGLVIERKANN